MEIPQAKRIIENLIEDISGRKGLGDEWEQIDDEVQEEIKEDWLRIILSS